jgi:hypothetical protein
MALNKDKRSSEVKKMTVSECKAFPAIVCEFSDRCGSRIERQRETAGDVNDERGRLNGGIAADDVTDDELENKFPIHEMSFGHRKS